MGSPSPDQTAGLFIERFNAGDASGMVQFYEEDAVFSYDGEQRAVGRGQIEKALAGFLMAGLKMRASVATVHMAGDVAMTRMKWELLDGAGAVQSSGVSCEVQRRGPDGLWRFQIDDVAGGSRG